MTWNVLFDKNGTSIPAEMGTIVTLPFVDRYYEIYAYLLDEPEWLSVQDTELFHYSSTIRRTKFTFTSLPIGTWTFQIRFDFYRGGLKWSEKIENVSLRIFDTSIATVIKTFGLNDIVPWTAAWVVDSSIGHPTPPSYRSSGSPCGMGGKIPGGYLKNLIYPPSVSKPIVCFAKSSTSAQAIHSYSWGDYICSNEGDEWKRIIIFGGNSFYMWGNLTCYLYSSVWLDEIKQYSI